MSPGPDAVSRAVAQARERLADVDPHGAPEVDRLADSVVELCRRWRITPGDWRWPGHGRPVLEVTRADGTEALLAVDEPGALDATARLMIAAQGRAYARVLDWAGDLGGLLTERLGAPLWTAVPDVAGQGEVVLDLLEEAWQVPLEVGDAGGSKSVELGLILADLAPRFGSDHLAVVRRARDYAEELRAGERREVVCHGDPHPDNVLSRGQGWALVDPEGLVGERAHDVGVLLRDGAWEVLEAESRRPGEGATLVRTLCERFAERTGTDPGRVWRWAFAERVVTGLHLRWTRHEDAGRAALDSAAVLLVEPG